MMRRAFQDLLDGLGALSVIDPPSASSQNNHPLILPLTLHSAALPSKIPESFPGSASLGAQASLPALGAQASLPALGAQASLPARFGSTQAGMPALLEIHRKIYCK